MKKSLIFLSMALATLASCTNDEVTEVAQNRAIRFDSFVENNTKAVTEVTSLTNFYVFGKYGATNTDYTEQIFNNELRSTQYYWVANQYYSFGAYANGEGGLLTDVSFNAKDGKLTFTNYTPDDTKDLVAAVAKVQCNADASQQTAVALNFKHMLSQVKFTFNTNDGENYTLNITDLKLHAAKTGTGEYNGTATWDLGSYNPDNNLTDQANEYVYDDIADVSVSTYTPQSKLVIPQAGTDKLDVTFTVKITGLGFGDEGITGDFTATLGVDVDGNDNDNKWLPGYRYNYTATINASTINPDLEQQKITFTPTVEEWKDTEQEITPEEDTTQP